MYAASLSQDSTSFRGRDAIPLPDVHSVIDNRDIKIGDNTENGRIDSAPVALQRGAENKIADIHQPEHKRTGEACLPIPPCIPCVSCPNRSRKECDCAKDDAEFSGGDCKQVVVGFALDEVFDTEDAVDTERHKNRQRSRDVVVEDFLDLKHRAFNPSIPENEIERDEDEECGDNGYNFHVL